MASTRINASLLLLGALLLGSAGCSTLPLLRGDLPEDKNIQAVDRGVLETKTLASLTAIDSAIQDYYNQTKRIPESLAALVPKYLPEIPMVELGLPMHRDSNKVTNYPSWILHDGVIDGAWIKDTGGWGYVHNDQQVVVFVDCTHLSSDGVPWYKRQSSP